MTLYISEKKQYNGQQWALSWIDTLINRFMDGWCSHQLLRRYKITGLSITGLSTTTSITNDEFFGSQNGDFNSKIGDCPYHFGLKSIRWLSLENRTEIRVSRLEIPSQLPGTESWGFPKLDRAWPFVPNTCNPILCGTNQKTWRERPTVIASSSTNPSAGSQNCKA